MRYLPVGLILSFDLSSAESCNLVDNIVQDDTTIRPFGNAVESGFCAYKRWNDYANFLARIVCFYSYFQCNYFFFLNFV